MLRPVAAGGANSAPQTSWLDFGERKRRKKKERKGRERKGRGGKMEMKRE